MNFIFRKLIRFKNLLQYIQHKNGIHAFFDEVTVIFEIAKLTPYAL